MEKPEPRHFHAGEPAGAGINLLFLKIGWFGLGRCGHRRCVRAQIDSRARWFARVEAARLRLFHREALERGRAERNIYRALREQIDAARRTYTQDFLAVSPAITDYLDKELICLAHDDAKLLGPDYPGSLV